MLILRAENRFVYYTLISFTRFVLFILFNFLLIKYMGRGVNGVFEANIIVVLIIFILLFPVIKENIAKTISFSLLKKMLYFGIPTIFTIFAMRILDLSDRRIIIHFFDDKSVGEYSVAYSLGMVGIMVFVNSFRTAWQPFFLELKKKPEAKDIFSKVATYYAVFIGLVYLGIVLFRKEIFRFYASQSYDISLSNIVPFVALGYVIFGFYLIMLPGVFFKDKTVFLLVASLTGALINIILNIILVPKLGIMGAAYTTVIGYFIMFVILYYLSSRIYKIHYELRRIFYAAVITGFPVLLYEIYQPEGALLKFVYRLILLIIPPVLYLSTGFLQTTEKMYLTGLVKKLLKIK
jgi:O-antigen/teichoic acid export membrane protein